VRESGKVGEEGEDEKLLGRYGEGPGISTSSTSRAGIEKDLAESNGEIGRLREAPAKLALTPGGMRLPYNSPRRF
jgi:hypothetical protein